MNLIIFIWLISEKQFMKSSNPAFEPDSLHLAEDESVEGIFLATQFPLWWVYSEKNPLAWTPDIFTQNIWPFSQLWKPLRPHI